MPASDHPGTGGPGPEGPDERPPWERPGRSVFDDPAPIDDDEQDGADRRDDTDVLPAVEARPPGRHSHAVLDGAAFGVYEEPDGRSRTPLVVGGLLALGTLAVGLLVWRAVNADADLDRPGEARTTTTTTAVEQDPAPTIEQLRALIPPGLDTCTPFGDPAEEPRSVSVLCPRSGVPEALGFVLYATIAEREAEFDRLVAEFGIPTSGTDCALGQDGAHDYIGFARVGRIACATSDDIIDFMWTSDEAPLLVRARGPGSFSDHYAFWDRIVERTDARFPLPVERALIEALPEDLSSDCRRDLDLNVATGGAVAVACEPGDAEPDVVSSVQFRDAARMTDWINFSRASLTSNVFADADAADACTPNGFGRRPPPPPTTTTVPSTTTSTSPTTTPGDDDPPPETTTSSTTTTTTTTTAPPPPRPDAGFTTYDLAGSTGRILCFESSSETNVLFWIRDGSLIGSIAVSDRSTGATMSELLEWWQSTGHRP